MYCFTHLVLSDSKFNFMHHPKTCLTVWTIGRCNILQTVCQVLELWNVQDLNFMELMKNSHYKNPLVICWIEILIKFNFKMMKCIIIFI
jgi:hypothetical protein